jgi:sulfite exporter TauE/SafE
LGRISTYVFLGAVAGYLSLSVSSQPWAVRSVPVAFCLLAGAYLIVEGLTAAGWAVWPGQPRHRQGCVFASQFASLLRGGRWENAFAAGVLTGFLPCGLVYAFLSLSASTGSVLWGAAVMATFGLGTMPLMLATGLGASLFTSAQRQQMLRAAAWCVVLTGVLTIARGATYLRHSDDAAAAQCPLCSESPLPR